MSSDPALQRRLGLVDAVVIGLAAMIGAGAFVSLGAAVDLTGPAAVLAVLLALVVAAGNATSTAQLAAQHPSSGGTYVYGREQLGPWWGFLAGWCFVIGKTASCAAMALVVAAYLVPGDGVWLPRLVAAAVVVVLVAVNLAGITRTAALARVLVAVSATSLVLTGVRLAVGLAQGQGGRGFAAPVPGWKPQAVLGVGDPTRGFWHEGLPGVASMAGTGPVVVGLAVAQAAAIVFFALAGYARVATLGEEVTEPRRTIPRAVLIALAVVGAGYLVLTVLLVAVGPPPFGLGGWGDAPFQRALSLVGAGTGWLVVVTIGATAAAAGALLALIAGVSRTVLAMAREADLPRPLSAVHAGTGVPRRAELVVGAVVLAVVLTSGDALAAITASSFGVLLYYAVANVAALTQEPAWRLFPRVLAVVGLAGCVLLVLALPGRSLVIGAVLVLLGIAYRALVLLAREGRGAAAS